VKALKKSLLLCLWILPIFFVSTAEGATTIVSMDPSSYTAEDIGVTMQINITLQDVTDLAGFEFKLAYDTTILTATEIEYGGIFGENYWPLINVIYDEEGWLGFSCMQMFGEDPVDGSGLLVTIGFTSDSEGTTVLDLYETKLGNSTGDPITHDVIDGSVTVIPEFPVAVIVPLFLIATLVVIILEKTIWSRRHSRAFIAT